MVKVRSSLGQAYFRPKSEYFIALIQKMERHSCGWRAGMRLPESEHLCLWPKCPGMSFDLSFTGAHVSDAAAAATVVMLLGRASNCIAFLPQFSMHVIDVHADHPVKCLGRMCQGHALGKRMLTTSIRDPPQLMALICRDSTSPRAPSPLNPLADHALHGDHPSFNAPMHQESANPLQISQMLWLAHWQELSLEFI